MSLIYRRNRHSLVRTLLGCGMAAGLSLSWTAPAVFAQDGEKKPEQATATAEIVDGDDESASTEAKEAGPSLSVGSKAPSIDVEHWMQQGDDKFPKVTDFEKGKVYVVEFWATWCPPCVASMPHLAELQQKYRDQGVRIISISDEDTETVNEFLAGNVRGKEDQTYQQLTDAYSLTTDPDQSAFKDYMEAAGQNGIPTAFLVGKDGVIEWIGHPMEMDEPLQQVVDGSWDRKKYAELMAEKKKYETMQQEAMVMLRAGKLKEAASFLIDKVANIEDPMTVLQMSAPIVQISMQEELPAEIVDTLIARLGKVGEGTSGDLKFYFYDFQARLFIQQKKFDEAIDAEATAIKFAPEEIKERLQSFLEEIMAMKDQPAEEETPADDTDKESDK